MKRVMAVVSVVLVCLVSARAQTNSGGDEPAPVAFRLTPLPGSGSTSAGTRVFAASFGGGDGEARFLVELDGERVGGVTDTGDAPAFNIAFSSGRFRHVPGSNPGPFLDKLAAALQAKAPRRSQARAETIPFGVAVLGNHVARRPNGGFDSGHEAGDWMMTKLFLAGGDGEVYFNFNPVSGAAEFSIKDEDYGDLVVEELSKVLW